MIDEILEEIQIPTRRGDLFESIRNDNLRLWQAVDAIINHLHRRCRLSCVDTSICEDDSTFSEWTRRRSREARNTHEEEFEVLLPFLLQLLEKSPYEDMVRALARLAPYLYCLSARPYRLETRRLIFQALAAVQDPRVLGERWAAMAADEAEDPELRRLAGDMAPCV